MRYKVHVGGKRYRRFETLEEARVFVGEVFKRTGIVLSIVEVKK